MACFLKERREPRNAAIVVQHIAVWKRLDHGLCCDNRSLNMDYHPLIQAGCKRLSDIRDPNVLPPASLASMRMGLFGKFWPDAKPALRTIIATESTDTTERVVNIWLSQ